MRKPFVAANWKMNKTAEQASALVNAQLPGLKELGAVEVVLCPPFVSLMTVASLLKGTNVGLGAQNLHWEASGAYTGEVAPAMVKEFCEYVILGHSERRAYFGETDETVNRKVKAAMAAGLVPIVCCGETLAEFEGNKTAEVLTRQIVEGCKGITVADPSKFVIAYEPVWAIGTGKAANGNDANNVIKNIIRPALQSVIGAAATQEVRVLYGGSVTAANGKEYFGQSDIDGALVGGASLKPEFVDLVKVAA